MTRDIKRIENYQLISWYVKYNQYYLYWD